MKKILLAFDGSHFSEGALDFATELNKINPVMVTGLFMPLVDYSSLWSYSGGGKTESMFVPLVEDEDSKAVQENIHRFENFCRAHKIEYRVHKDFFDFAVPQLSRESRFADLLILSSQRFYEQAGSSAPNNYLKEALQEVECPVLVVPEKFDFPISNILTYDGKQESVYAIKQFAYLFPELSKNRSLLVYVSEKPDDSVPEQVNIEEFAKCHFEQLSVLRLDVNPKKQFGAWLTDKHATLVVCGSFGKSAFTQIFHKSFAADLIKEHRLPVFIAHK